MASGVETITGPASSRYGANAMHGVINVISNPINSDSKLYTNVGPNNYKNFKVRTGNKKDWSLDGFFANNDGFRNDSGYDQQKIKIQSNFTSSRSQFVCRKRIRGLIKCRSDKERSATSLVGEESESTRTRRGFCRRRKFQLSIIQLRDQIR